MSVFKYKVTENEAKAWKGSKQIIKDAYLISSSNNMLVRIDPTFLDAIGTEFNMVNSRNHSPLGVTLTTATKFDGVLSRAADDAGLYTVGVKIVMFTPTQNQDITKLDNVDVTKTLFALQDATGGFTSPFTLGIKEGTAVQVTDILVNDTKVGVDNTNKYSTVVIDLIKDNTITFDDPAGVYDAYITYSDADKKLFDLTHDNEKMTFKITNENGIEVEYEVLFTFESDETKKNYIVYTDNSLDEDGNTRVYASIYTPGSAETELKPIETDKEWKIIETILEQIQEQVKESTGENEQ